VRSLLGLFVQFRRFYDRYDRLAAPIQKLLAAVKKDVQLVLETDGSDDGWGAILLDKEHLGQRASLPVCPR